MPKSSRTTPEYQAAYRLSERGKIRRKAYEQSGKNAIRNQKKRERFRELKNKPCMDCGISYPPCVMDFDHRDPSTKKRAVGSFVNSSLAALQEEIAKCDLVCANCHRLRTQLRRTLTQEN